MLLQNSISNLSAYKLTKEQLVQIFSLFFFRFPVQSGDIAGPTLQLRKKFLLMSKNQMLAREEIAQKFHPAQTPVEAEEGEELFQDLSKIPVEYLPSVFLEILTLGQINK